MSPNPRLSSVVSPILNVVSPSCRLSHRAATTRVSVRQPTPTLTLTPTPTPTPTPSLPRPAAHAQHLGQLTS